MSPDIISEIEVREGGGQVTDDAKDGGGRTQYGISENANPEAWKDGKVTEEEARTIYTQKYILYPKFNLLPLNLQPLMIDWGVTSGPQLVIGELQKILGVKVDGVIGPATLAAVNAAPLTLLTAIVASRIRQVGRIVQKDPSQVKFLSGWLNRALEFLNASR